MTTKLADDIDYLKDLAEAGDCAPSLSGRFALLWFGLAAVTLMVHWAILRGLIPGMTEQWVGLVWLVFGLVGGIGSYLIGLSIRDLPGQASAGNRVDRHTWKITALGLFLFAASIFTVVMLRAEATPLLFDMIMPTAFLTYAVSYGATAAFTRGISRWLPVIMSLVFVVITILFVGSPELYLAACVGVVAVWSVAGYRQLREEPKAIR